MKKVLISFWAFCLSLVVSAEDAKLIIEPFTIQPGQTVSVPILMENEVEINGFQFFFTLSEGLSLAGKPKLESERVGTHTDEFSGNVESNEKTMKYNNLDGEHRIIITDGGNFPFSGKEGAVVILSIKAADDIPCGNHTLSVTNSVLSTTEKTKVVQDPYDVNVRVPFPVFNITAGAADHGKVEGAGEYEQTSECTLTAVPDEGYNFVKWMVGEEEVSTENPYTFVVEKAVTVTPVFEIGKYTVTFMADGKVIKKETLEYGAAITLPTEVPVKAGYTFKDWGEVAATVPANDVVYEAQFTPNPYSVVFMNGQEIVKEEIANCGSEIKAPEATPEKEGHEFLGWYDGKNYFAEGATVPAGGVTYYAKFTEHLFKLTYIYEPTDADGNVVAEDAKTFGTYDVACGTPLPEANAPVMPDSIGNIFVWSIKNAEGELADMPFEMPDADLTLYGNYVVNVRYPFTLKLNGKTIYTDSIAVGAKIVVPDSIFDLTLTDETKYVFDGWTPEIPAVMPDSALVVTGKHSPVKYTITYKLGEYSIIQVDTIGYNQAIVAPNMEKVGHTFWWDEVIPKTMPAENLTFVGTYSVNSYKFTIQTGDSVLVSENVFYDSMDMPELPEAPEKVGYSFKGWSKVPSSMPAQNVTITAIYEPNLYYVTYMYESDTVRVDTVACDAALPEAPKMEEKEGYIFAWEDTPEKMPAGDLVVTGVYNEDPQVGIKALEGVANADVYDMQGRLVMPGMTADDIRKTLPRGIYIINRKKVIIR